MSDWKDFAKRLTERSRLEAEAFQRDGSGLRQPADDTHAWVIEEVDGGPAGSADFWKCSVCGASGSPLGARDPRVPEPFLPGPAMKLSRKCEEAQAQIKAYREKHR